MSHSIYSPTDQRPNNNPADHVVHECLLVWKVPVVDLVDRRGPIRVNCKLSHNYGLRGEVVVTMCNAEAGNYSENQN